MAIDYHRLKTWSFTDVTKSYSTQDTLLYALSLGLGRDPMDKRCLPFVYEGSDNAPSVIPTMAVVLGTPGFWMRDPATGIDWVRIVHGENGLVLHKPLPSRGTVVGRTRVTHIVDKGAAKGAVVTVERTLRDGETGECYATIRHVSFCRGDGGFSAHGQPSDVPPAPLQATPETPAHLTDDQPTRPEMALLYRLLADSNPLHADPVVAATAGFPRPILHGLATYGLSALAIMRSCINFDPTRLRSIDARFSAPLYPGETVRTEMWLDGSTVRFRCRALERDVLVLSHGRAEIV